MLGKIVGALLGLSAASASAQGYTDHKFTMIYRERPCTEVVGTIDGAWTIEGAADKSTLWGFLLGFDQANGGLQGGEETTLVRLRKACAENPNSTTLNLLEGFKQ